MVHGTAVAFGPVAVLITGASGTGKSTLALELLAIGAQLVGDDKVALTRDDDVVFASPVSELEGRIEARGIGILRVAWTPRSQVRLIADLDAAPDARLPEPKTTTLLGCDLPVLALGNRPGSAAALRAILTGGIEFVPSSEFIRD